MRRYDLSSFQSGFVVSSSLLGALAGSAAAFVVGDKLGRKRELMLGAVLYGECATFSHLCVWLEFVGIYSLNAVMTKRANCDNIDLLLCTPQK